MEETYNLIIVDDHSIFRDGLSFVLEQSKNLKVIAQASNGKEFLDLLDTCKPDLVLMDISMPVLNGIDATREALKKYPELKIIALSMHSNEMDYYQILEAGVKGFVSKASSSEELFKAISLVLKGENYFSNQILCKIIKDHTREGEIKKVAKKGDIKLSKRENEVLELICAGYLNSEIAAKLGISTRTIEGHRSSLLSKTGTKNSVNLVLYVRKNQILFD